MAVTEPCIQQCSCVPAGAIETAFKFFAGRASTGFIIPEWFPTPENFQYHDAVASLDSAVYGIIDARQLELSHSGQPPQVSQLSLVECYLDLCL